MEKAFSQDYALGYLVALNHTKEALNELVTRINETEEEILSQAKEELNEADAKTKTKEDESEEV